MKLQNRDKPARLKLAPGTRLKRVSLWQDLKHLLVRSKTLQVIITIIVIVTVLAVMDVLLGNI